MEKLLINGNLMRVKYRLVIIPTRLVHVMRQLLFILIGIFSIHLQAKQVKSFVKENYFSGVSISGLLSENEKDVRILNSFYVEKTFEKKDPDADFFAVARAYNGSIQENMPFSASSLDHGADKSRGFNFNIKISPDTIFIDIYKKTNEKKSIATVVIPSDVISDAMRDIPESEFNGDFKLINDEFSLDIAKTRESILNSKFSEAVTVIKNDLQTKIQKYIRGKFAQDKLNRVVNESLNRLNGVVVKTEKANKKKKR